MREPAVTRWPPPPPRRGNPCSAGRLTRRLALADAQRPIDPAVSRYERALRRVEGRAGIDPAGAAARPGGCGGS
jgi:hypothetical protein